MKYIIDYNICCNFKYKKQDEILESSLQVRRDAHSVIVTGAILTTRTLVDIVISRRRSFSYATISCDGLGSNSGRFYSYVESFNSLGQPIETRNLR